MSVSDANTEEKKTDKRTKRVTAVRRAQEEKTAQLIAGMGLENVLYPPLGPSHRHPFTTEVIVYAEMIGYTQKTIGELIGCSQPTVSGWRKGEGKAETHRLLPLIRRLSPRVSTGSSHLLTVVESIEFSLPENWELEMLCWHFRVKHRVDTTPDTLRSSIIGQLETDLMEDLNALEAQLNQETDQLSQSIIQLTKAREHAETEKLTNDKKQLEYDKAVEAFLSDRSDVANLEPELRAEFIEKSIDRPCLSNQSQQTYAELKASIALAHSLSEDKLTDNLHEKLKLHKVAAEQQLAEMRDNHQNVLKNKSPFGHYDEALAAETIRVATLDELDKYLGQLISQLYPTDHQFSFEIEVRHDYSYHSSRKVSINVSPEALLHDYLLMEVTPTYVFEQVQLSGREFAVIQDAEQSPQPRWQLPELSHKHEFCEKLTCYILQSSRLALVTQYRDFRTKKEVKVLKVFSDVEEMLQSAASHLTGDDMSQWKTQLAEQGYLLRSARTVY
uniref:Chromosome binding protein protein n=1 Tax=Vibrio sp. 09022 TaxID=452804 RepID=A9M556_9VIBR|nr:hypothetical protein [Vibrio sp. 09022]ABX77154.1 chromosome binding protein protein [Vibrio sp. 09022]